MGSATLYQLARRGVRVLGLDQFAPPHSLGSTHGETRITRLAVGEGAAYMPLVRRTHEIWRELEAVSGETLLTLTGGLIICPQSGGAHFHGGDNFVMRTAELARQYGIDHQLQTAAEVRDHFPMLKVGDHEQAFYEPTGGVVSPERAVAVQLELAQRHGATIQTNEKVLAYQAGADCQYERRHHFYHCLLVVDDCRLLYGFLYGTTAQDDLLWQAAPRSGRTCRREHPLDDGAINDIGRAGYPGWIT
jgi:sarcosine oxidase